MVILLCFSLVGCGVTSKSEKIVKQMETGKATAYINALYPEVVDQMCSAYGVSNKKELINKINESGKEEFAELNIKVKSVKAEKAVDLEEAVVELLETQLKLSGIDVDVVAAKSVKVNYILKMDNETDEESATLTWIKIKNKWYVMPLGF